MSVALQMVTNKGDQGGLFRGAVMQSGAPLPVGPIENGQQYYDYMVEQCGCSKAKDTLDCLRKTPYATFKRAMDMSPNFFAYQARVYCCTVSVIMKLHGCLGTRTGVAAPCRWRLPDRGSTIFCPARPCIKRTNYSRCVLRARLRYEANPHVRKLRRRRLPFLILLNKHYVSLQVLIVDAHRALALSQEYRPTEAISENVLDD